MREKHTGPCTVPGCENAAFYKSAKICEACYSALYYWRGASPTRLLKRQRDLAKYEARMQLLLPANVVNIERRKKA